MKQILWFRRDLRIRDNAILANAKDEVLPIFIFDEDILKNFHKDDKRVNFLYESVKNLKEDLKALGLNLEVFHGKPKDIFKKLSSKGFDEVLASVDFEDYAKSRDEEIEEIIPFKRYYDSYLIHPNDGLKADGTPYRVFTPFYKNLRFLWEADGLQEHNSSENIKNLKLVNYDFTSMLKLEDIDFKTATLPDFLKKSAYEVLEDFKSKISNYTEGRDFFYQDNTSSLGVHLRFGLISPVIAFNIVKKFKVSNEEKEFFVRELFWREFYNYILYHFPRCESQNLNGIEVNWNKNEDDFKAWCDGKTGVPLIDAAMIKFNETGMMHNRLRMIVASYLTKNLLIDWKWGEKYFALKLLDYEASSNIGSWQWAASTGADSVPYFRVFNPYLQSKKFDKDGIFIKSVIPKLKDVDAKLFHTENALQNDMFLDYPKQVVSIDFSRKRAIEEFKRANNEKN
ncbi:MAG: deoxyribodipyrimidine photo-lyase [Sulfurovum sp.]|jgi:deoxyribodipyrimidine photo-lyase